MAVDDGGGGVDDDDEDDDGNCGDRGDRGDRGDCGASGDTFVYVEERHRNLIRRLRLSDGKDEVFATGLNSPIGLATVSSPPPSPVLPVHASGQHQEYD